MTVLLLGGSKSGKSMLAQNLAKKLASGGPMYYLATMEPSDGEDRERIQKHIEDRAGWGFETVEQGRTLPACFSRMDPAGTVLLDSVTALLAGEMFGPGAPDAEAYDRAAEDLLALGRRMRNVIFVCDWIFSDPGQYEQWTVAYIRGLALICRRLAAQCDAVAEVTAGLAKWHKGAMQ